MGSEVQANLSAAHIIHFIYYLFLCTSNSYQLFRTEYQDLRKIISITTEDWNRIGFRPSISRLAIQLQKFFSEKGKKFSMSVTSVCATIPKSLSSNDVKQQLFYSSLL